MMTASDDVNNELLALKSGVDDFVYKPIKLPVLFARMQALLRRVSKSESNDEIQVSDLVLDKSQRCVTQQGENISLSEIEFELLWLLASVPGEVVSREQLFKDVLGRDYDGIDRSIDMKISNIRKKLHDSDTPSRYIRSMRSRGYLLIQ